jgi:protein involved in temperature-dependent protein secretion
VTDFPHATNLDDWKQSIVRGAMLQAEVVPGILNTTFAERIRALAVVEADRDDVDQALNALRDELRRAIDQSYTAAAELAGEWWA